jgi:hypothetical protein
MKTILKISVLTFLLIVAASPCFALRSIGIISKKEAKDMGLEIRAKGNGEQVWLELEFKPEGKLKAFSHVELQISDGEKLLLGYARLQETRTSSGSVVVRFLADRAYVEKITFCIVAGLDAGYELRVKDFIEPEKVR